MNVFTIRVLNNMDKNIYKFADKTKPCLANIVPEGTSFDQLYG